LTSFLVGDVGSFHNLIDFEGLLAERVQNILSIIQHDCSISSASEIAALGFGHAVYSLGSNSRVRGRRARAELDWSPKHASLTGWIENEMPVR
jgi:hypothetical protein